MSRSHPLEPRRGNTGRSELAFMGLGDDLEDAAVIADLSIDAALYVANIRASQSCCTPPSTGGFRLPCRKMSIQASIKFDRGKSGEQLIAIRLLTGLAIGFAASAPFPIAAVLMPAQHRRTYGAIYEMMLASSFTLVPLVGFLDERNCPEGIAQQCRSDPHAHSRDEHDCGRNNGDKPVHFAP